MHQHLRSDSDALPRAAAAAAAAARQAGVTVRDLSTPAMTAAAAELFSMIWRTSVDATPVSAELMRALSRTGNYVAGAYSGDTLVGASMAFFTDESPPALHSHICGVPPEMQGRNVGFAIKLHQRSWALHRGINTITWTADPLVRRNVYFNLAKLAATVTDYLPDFYGPMTDGVNAHDASDRLLFTWALAADQVAAAAEGASRTIETAAGAGMRLLAVGGDGRPVVGEAVGSVSYCEIPADIVRLRETDPSLARTWRKALRDTLAGALHDGWRVAGVSREGCYVLRREGTTTGVARARMCT